MNGRKFIAGAALCAVAGLWIGGAFAAVGGKTLSTGVEIPDGGVPTWDGRMQYTTRMETHPDAATLLGGPRSRAAENLYLKWKWRMNLADPKTGLDNAGLIAGVKKIAAESGWKTGQEDWYDVAARMFDFLVDNVQIGFSKYDCFPAISAWDRHARPSGSILWSHASDVDAKYAPNLRAEIETMRREGRVSIGKDFDHSAPDWDDIFKIGFPGMKARVDAIDRDTPFDRAEKRTAAAMMRFLDRLLATAKAHPEKYENLQVRVCGWNVRWNDMPKSEQDEYILRAGCIAR